MKYLLDSNTLITAKNDCYRFEFAASFWSWLAMANLEGLVFSIVNVKRELDGEGDNLTQWVNANDIFLSPDAATNRSMTEIGKWVQEHRQFTDAAKQEFFRGADLPLLAHAHAHGFKIVTFEKDEPEAKARIKIPTVGNAFGVKTLNLYQMISELRGILGAPL